MNKYVICQVEKMLGKNNMTCKEGKRSSMVLFKQGGQGSISDKVTLEKIPEGRKRGRESFGPLEEKVAGRGCKGDVPKVE